MKSVIAFSALAVIFGLASALWLSVNNSADDIIIKNVPTNVLLPDTLSQNAQIGKLAFEAKCTSCHGTNAAGRDGVAPPLVHIITTMEMKASKEQSQWVSKHITGHLVICLLWRV